MILICIVIVPIFIGLFFSLAIFSNGKLAIDGGGFHLKGYHNILNNDFDQKENKERIRILKYLKDTHIDINIEAGNDDLDKECPHHPIRNRYCDYLENILPKVFNETLSAADLTNIGAFYQQKKLEEINIKSIKLNRILDFNPKKSFRVFFN